MNHINGFQLPRNAQTNSALFNGTIPGEIRDRILAFSLSCAESPKAWDRDSSYVVRVTLGPVAMPTKACMLVLWLTRPETRVCSASCR